MTYFWTRRKHRCCRLRQFVANASCLFDCIGKSLSKNIVWLICNILRNPIGAHLETAKCPKTEVGFKSTLDLFLSQARKKSVKRQFRQRGEASVRTRLSVSAKLSFLKKKKVKCRNSPPASKKHNFALTNKKVLNRNLPTLISLWPYRFFFGLGRSRFCKYRTRWDK